MLFSPASKAIADNTGDATKPLLFGIFPYLPATRIEKIFSPFAKDLGETLQKSVYLRTQNTFDHFRSAVIMGKYDIVYIQPFDYVRAAAENNYVPLVRRSKPLKAILVTRKGNEIKTLQQLSGKTISMPPADAAVSLLGTIELQLAGMKKGKDIYINYEKNHIACMKKVLTKKTVACMTARAPFEYFNNQSGNQLIKVFETRGISPSLIAIHKRISVVEAEKIRLFFLGLEHTDSGKIRLESIKMKHFIETNDKQYDMVRKIWTELNQ
jgi:phosphonate transport system substrate-binding protein